MTLFDENNAVLQCFGITIVTNEPTKNQVLVIGLDVAHPPPCSAQERSSSKLKE